MAAAWLLTCLAIAGIFAGLLIGHSRTLPAHFAAVGGGLLAGIGVFWLIPEVGASTGLPGAAGLALAVFVVLALLDHFLTHAHVSAAQRGAVGPLLSAVALHSFLDGWSTRAVPLGHMTGITVLTGLALHKIPEGLALGWLVRRSIQPAARGVLLCCLMEIFTLLGAWVEPRANHSGALLFGFWSSVLILSVVAGSFLFFGFHTVFSERKKGGVIPVFLASLGAMALIAWAKIPGI